MDGKDLYDMYAREMLNLNIEVDEFDDLDAAEQTSWERVADKLEPKS